jgi:basic membrane protein A
MRAFKVTAILLCVLFLFGCAGAVSEQKEPQNAAHQQKIGLILCNCRGDNSVADTMYQGVMLAKEQCDFILVYSECITPSDPEFFLEEYASTGEYDLIVIETFTFEEAIQRIAPQYPDQKFLYWDCTRDCGNNVMCAYIAMEQTAFMSGAFASLMDSEGQATIDGTTTTWQPRGVTGMISGIESPDSIRYLAGFQAGAKYINPEIRVMYSSVGSWSDLFKSKELALSMYEQGAVIIAPFLGIGIYGTIEAAKESDGFCIGFDRPSNNDIDLLHVIGTGANNADYAIAETVADFVRYGTFDGGSSRCYSCAEGYQDFVYQKGLVVPDSVAYAMEQIKRRLGAGEIQVPVTFEEADAFSDSFFGKADSAND